MKALKPSHRENKRYLLIKGKDVSTKNIESALLKFIGVLGYAKASPMFIKVGKTQIILSINRKSLEEVLASFEMSGKELMVVKVSGSVGKVK